MSDYFDCRISGNTHQKINVSGCDRTTASEFWRGPHFALTTGENNEYSVGNISVVER